MTYSASLGQAGTGAASLAKGVGGLGLLLAQDGFSLARKGIRAARTPRVAAEPQPDATTSSSWRKRLLIGGVAGAALVGGAALFSWSRRHNAPPPPAAEPPTLATSPNGVSASPAAPTTPASAN